MPFHGDRLYFCKRHCSYQLQIAGCFIPPMVRLHSVRYCSIPISAHLPGLVLQYFVPHSIPPCSVGATQCCWYSLTWNGTTSILFQTIYPFWRSSAWMHAALLYRISSIPLGASWHGFVPSTSFPASLSPSVLPLPTLHSPHSGTPLFLVVHLFFL